MKTSIKKHKDSKLILREQFHTSSRFIVSRVMKRDLLDGKASYIHDGQLYFDQIRVSESEFSFFNKNKLLATLPFNLKRKINFAKGETLTLALGEAGGKMKIKVV